MTSRGQDLVTLTINGERWSLRSTFEDCGPDSRVYTLLGQVGGHALKHVAAAMGAFWLLRMMRLRKPC